MSMRISRRDWVMLLALSLIWGAAFIFIELSLPGFPPMTLVFVRLASAALLLLGYLRLRGRSLSGGIRLWTGYAVLGLLNLAAPFMILVWAMTYISAGLTAILNASTPLWTVMVAHMLTRDEKATAGKLAGVALGFAGVIVMIGPKAMGGLGSDVLPELGCLFAALLFAFAGVYARRFAALGVGAEEVATGQLAAASIMVLPFAILIDRPWALPMPGIEPIAGMIALATICSALAYILYFRLIESAGAVNALLITFLCPIFTILLAIPILGETVAPSQWLGIALIGAGLIAIDGRFSPWRATRAAPPG
jgi:drug/metabolite transporter (DMT)-like permease